MTKLKCRDEEGDAFSNPSIIYYTSTSSTVAKKTSIKKMENIDPPITDSYRYIQYKNLDGIGTGFSRGPAPPPPRPPRFVYRCYNAAYKSLCFRSVGFRFNADLDP